MASGKVELSQMALLWITGTLRDAVGAGGHVAPCSWLTLPAIIAAARWLPLTQLGPAHGHRVGRAAGPGALVVVGAAVMLTARHLRLRRADRLHRSVRPGDRPPAARQRRDGPGTSA